VAWLRSRCRERESEETDDRKGKILGRKAGFWSTLDPIFFQLRP
jgi:hypothetical protein